MGRLALVLLLLAGTLTALTEPARAATGPRLAVGEVVDIAPGTRPGDHALDRPPLRDDPGGERFYFVMPDRFADGDPGNDRGGSPSTDRLVTGFDPTDKGFYHGGDLAGLRARLGYLKGMGTTAIWMTPMFANKWVQGSGTDVSAAYHGYWTTDFTRLDPHFGTTDDMRAVIADAHRLGMRVFFDIVANHTADVIDYAEHSHEYRNTRDFPYRDRAGSPVDVKERAGRADFPEITAFPYTPVVSDPHAKSPAWLNDPTLYHNRGDSTFTGESTEYGDFSGLDDLMTENPRVVRGMEDIFTSWIDTLDIDGYRVDTVKHVNLEFWQALSPYVKAYARTHGKPDFFVFGEVYDADPTVTSNYTTRGRMQATLDFPFRAGALDLLSGKGSTHLASVLLDDDRYTDADSNAYSLPTFLGNHDMGRLAWMLRDRGVPEPELLRRLELGNALMYLWRGNPVVYYGDEQGFAGGGGDKLARQDMFASRTPEYAAEKFVGADRTGAQDNFDPDHPLYRQLASLSSFVDRDGVWRRGAQTLRYAQGDVLAFSRADAREHLVVVNAGTRPATVDIPVSSRCFHPELSTAPTADPTALDSAGPTAGHDRTVRVTVPPLSLTAYRADDRLDTSAPAPTLALPPTGTVLDNRVELRADGVTSAFARVSFAARVEGRREWTPLGTDDAAPYRVFADVAGLPGAAAGKRVELRAVADDGSRLGADGAAMTLVTAPPLPPSPEWLVVHYNRPAGDYAGWGLHVWGDVESPTSWQSPLPLAGETPYGRVASIRLLPGAHQVGFVVHQGDTKDGGDRLVNPVEHAEVWLRQGDDTVHTSEPSTTPGGR
ncbi:alpha-amylase family glycosyl hydrolase [Actinokineospora enzanensis]|uniref:alpha-amylase family glycosyl hydrolase n=1 Tax=Actinokineospora enzanensis TaxID=155975 RepID=UPI0003675DBB|nr:alpha-amylase family glycosyl hydrolase [Actinokineospora enzanensis]